ncbi:MAG: cytochrome c biogenesis protein CcsA [Deltaproteobacteria bacterium]|nr:cytochrome c biogenesis protein CcsA [Deltaproteobacteria bacterium]
MKYLLFATLLLYAVGFLASLYCVVAKRPHCERVPVVFVLAGLASQTVWLAGRMYATGHAPMASMYETLVFYSWTTVLVTLLVIYRYRERTVELVTVPFALFALIFAVYNETPGKQLALILRTRWFETHVAASFAAYALFTLSFAGAALYLLRGFSGGDEAGLKKYQAIAGRAVLWGFFFFSASMFAGAVWGYLAWGMYWMWEPKVIWSFIVWFYYAGAMHAYYVKEWRGQGLCGALAGGFFVVIFTYMGVSMLMKSSHNF